MRFNSGQYTRLEIFPCNASEVSCLRLSDGVSVREKSARCFRVCFDLVPHTDFNCEASGCAVSFAYLSSSGSFNARGVSILAGDVNAAANPYREQYHFTPPAGWLNDPNGLCFFGGWYHLYYQFYPHARRWGPMHWGHATSADLVHWIHQPVFLLPQDDLLDGSFVGGAFSGSAVAEAERIRFFLTRHHAPRGRDSEMSEVQVSLESADSIVPGPETVVVRDAEKRFSHHFRDPKIFSHNGTEYMVLGSCADGKPAVLLYRHTESAGWQYTGPLLSVEKDGCETVECPDVFALDGFFICTAACMSLIDVHGRKNPVYYHLGSFDGVSLTAHVSDLFDFGGNLYALQTFEHAGRRIAIGWIADFYDEYRDIDGGVCGSMSLPRELTVRRNRLCQKPVREVYELPGEILYSGPAPSSDAAFTLRPEGNAYYAEITFGADTDFTAVLAECGMSRLTLSRQGGLLCLLSGALPSARFEVRAETITRVEVFFDRRVAEVFINDGAAAGTKTFYTDSPDGFFSFFAEDPSCVQNIRVRLVSGRCANLPSFPAVWR